jgi:hypothetical protein
MQVQVAAYNDRFEASIVVAKLRALGLVAYGTADDLAGNLPLMQLSEGGCRVFVTRSHADIAVREIATVGRHALDTCAMGARSEVTDLERSRRIGYLIATLIGWGLGYGPWQVLFGS